MRGYWHTDSDSVDLYGFARYGAVETDINPTSASATPASASAPAASESGEARCEAVCGEPANGSKSHSQTGGSY